MTSHEVDELPWYKSPRLIAQIVALAGSIMGGAFLVGGQVKGAQDQISGTSRDLGFVSARVAVLESSQARDERELSTFTQLVRDIDRKLDQLIERRGRPERGP